jgi:hypothetical protein
MDEHDELQQLKDLWQTPTPFEKTVDVSGLLRSVRRKQWALRLKQSYEWALFFLAAALIVWVIQKPMSNAMLAYVVFWCVTLPIVQWRYFIIRQLPTADLTRGQDSAALLSRARIQSESELAMARFNLRLVNYMLLLGLAFLPWLWLSVLTVSTVLNAGIWWYGLLLLTWVLSRRRERLELQRLAWLESQSKSAPES